MTFLENISPSSQRKRIFTVLVCRGVQHRPSTQEPQYLGRYFFTLEHPAYVNLTGSGDFLVLLHFLPFCKKAERSKVRGNGSFSEERLPSHPTAQEQGPALQKLTFRLLYMGCPQGRTSQIRVSFTRRHSGLSLVTRVEIPVPQVLEH